MSTAAISDCAAGGELQSACVWQQGGDSSGAAFNTRSAGGQSVLLPYLHLTRNDVNISLNQTDGRLPQTQVLLKLLLKGSFYCRCRQVLAQGGVLGLSE